MIKRFLCALAVISTFSVTAGQQFRQPDQTELKSAAIPELKQPVAISLVSPGKIKVDAVLTNGSKVSGAFTVPKVQSTEFKNEAYENIPPFKPRAWGWNKGTALKNIRGKIGSLKHGSLVIKDGIGPDATCFENNKDYHIDEKWGAFGTVPGSRITSQTKVYASYERGLRRIDSVILKDDKLYYRIGKPALTVPQMPQLKKGEVRVANIILKKPGYPLGKDNFYPISERFYPVREKPIADKLLPETMKKLRSGKKLLILAWGDSVTEGYHGLKHNGKWTDRWQNQFVARLRQRFPKANIELVTEGWGGHNTTNYFSAPKGHIHNYQEKVLDRKPDLIITEFLNDSSMKDPLFSQRYQHILKDFRSIGTEWIAILPHHTSGSSNIDGKDSRPYIDLLRNFCIANDIACVDVATRFGRLHRQGVEPMLLMVNNHNHPLRQGMSAYADALMDIFPAK